jgi:hypothetical protein
LWRVKVRHPALRVRIRTTSHSNHIFLPTRSPPYRQGLNNNDGCNTAPLPCRLPPFPHPPGSPARTTTGTTLRPHDDGVRRRVHTTMGHDAAPTRQWGATPPPHDDGARRHVHTMTGHDARVHTTTGRDTALRRRGHANIQPSIVAATLGLGKLLFNLFSR